MVRVVAGVAAWVAGTAIAVCVAWLGANVVVRDAGVQSGLPVVNAAVVPPSAVPSAAPPATTSAARAPSGAAPAREASPASGTPAAAGSSAPAPSATAPSAAASSAAGVHAYTLSGGRVTLNVAGGAVQLVTAVPGAGDSVQTWNGAGWLRVDFSAGPDVSSLIASWYQHAPTITVTNG